MLAFKTGINNFVPNSVFFFLTLSLISYVGISSSYYSYLFLFLSILISFRFLSTYREKISFTFDDMFLVFSYLFVWGYGALVALFNPNDSVFILRNFFGMLCVASILPLKTFSKEKLYLLILLAALVNFIYAVYFFLINSFSKPVSLSTLYNLRSYYSIGLFTIFPIMSVFIGKYILNETYSFKKVIFGMAILAILFFACLVTTISKGNFLAFSFLVFCILAVKAFRVFFKFNIQVFLIISVGVLFVFLGFILTDALDYLLYLYSDKETANSIRALQSTMISQEFAITGKGLGATLESGYSRDDYLSYGFELSYHNIVHKFGIVSFILFSCFVYFFVKSLYLCFIEDSTRAYMALGGLMYLVPSYGNPMIFSPLSVTLMCISCTLLSFPNKPQAR